MQTSRLDDAVKKISEFAINNQQGIYFLNTKQELKNFYLEWLGKYKVWKAIASVEDWLPVDQEFLQDFRKKLDERHIDTRVIIKESWLVFEPSNLQYREVKTTPSSYGFRSSIDILDDKLLIMNPDLNVLWLVIEIELVLDIFNDIFDLLWDTLPSLSSNK